MRISYWSPCPYSLGNQKVALCSSNFPTPYLSNCSLWPWQVCFRCTCCSFTWGRSESLLGPWRIQIRNLWIYRFVYLGPPEPSGRNCTCFWRLSLGFSQWLSYPDYRQKCGNRFMAITQGFYLSIRPLPLFSALHLTTFFCLSLFFWFLSLQFMELIRYKIQAIQLSYCLDFQVFRKGFVVIWVFRLAMFGRVMSFTTFWWLGLWW